MAKSGLQGAAQVKRPTVSDSLKRLMAPRSIAVVGASRDPAKIGHAFIRIPLENGYKGRLYPVNPGGGEICGIPCAPSITHIKGKIDLALLVVPAERSIHALRQCAERGVEAVIGITSGFAEAGQAGAGFQRELGEILATAPFRMIGPNSEGIVVPKSKLQLTFSPMFNAMVDGPVRIVSQSGGMSGMIASRLAKRGVGIGALFSTGNEDDINTADLMEYFADDPGTGVVLAYLEEIRDARRFVKAVRRYRNGRAVVVMKGGRSPAGGRAAMSHTGAIAGDDRVVDGVFRELDVVRVRDSRAAVDATAALSMMKWMRGRRVGIVGIAGGFGVEMTDLVETSGLTAPPFSDKVQKKLRPIMPFYGAVGNPIDMTGTIINQPDMFRDVLNIAIESGEVDAIVILLTFVGEPKIIEAVIDANAASDLPILFCWTGGGEDTSPACQMLYRAGIPTFDSPAAILTGLEALKAQAGL